MKSVPHIVRLFLLIGDLSNSSVVHDATHNRWMISIGYLCANIVLNLVRETEFCLDN